MLTTLVAGRASVQFSFWGCFWYCLSPTSCHSTAHAMCTCMHIQAFALPEAAGTASAMIAPRRTNNNDLFVCRAHRHNMRRPVQEGAINHMPRLSRCTRNDISTREYRRCRQSNQRTPQDRRRCGKLHTRRHPTWYLNNCISVMHGHYFRHAATHSRHEDKHDIHPVQLALVNVHAMHVHVVCLNKHATGRAHAYALRELNSLDGQVASKRRVIDYLCHL